MLSQACWQVLPRMLEGSQHVRLCAWGKHSGQVQTAHLPEVAWRSSWQ